MAASQGSSATTSGRAEEARDNAPMYVWELPVRIVHWTIVVSILVLTVTGLFMHAPFLRPSAGEAEPALMAQVRFIHELFAIAFTIAVGLRVYWAFAGNQYAHWRALVPHTRAQWRNLIETGRFYGLRRSEPPPGLGHNALASVAYLVVYAGFAGQILTGLLLFGWLMETGPLDMLFGWGDLVPGGIQTVRLAHYFLTFLFIVFTIHHVYSSALTDVIERNGLLSSIVTGFKGRPALPTARKPEQAAVGSQPAQAVRPAEAAPAAVPEAPDA